ncbi:MMPL family transporter [Desulfofundulus thermobenzoicus]|uniref:MMPL family transporter n=1 Tax=Desulfofundulus thermobenzoicus TaxID=29376 RepID=A0A6N7ITJ7_9FIRM|nr:efflux RND transporter permease subunit [Desulfofundulus thermobenzoicus]MQL53455.1 MMPL family transporter [Desulfofundulus thermobenzoicus]
MNWPAFAIKHKYTVFALVLTMVFFGLYAKNVIKLELFPDTSPPMVNVITVYPGVTASDVARDVSKPLEEEFATIEGVTKISSSSQEGLSVVRVEFNYAKDVDQAAVDVQNAIGRIKGSLPADIQEPQVLKFSSQDKPVLTLALSSDSLDMVALRTLADNEIKNALQLADGVGVVDVLGGYRRQVNVYVDRHRLEALNISLDRVAAAIGGGNISLPAGRVTQQEQEYLIRVTQERLQSGELAGIILENRGGHNIYLKDVARIEDSSQEQRSSYNFNGKNSLAVQIIKKCEANTVEVVERVKEKLAELERQFPEIKFAVADDDSIFTLQVVENMTASVRDALIFTTAIILLFLISLNESIIVAFSMPLSLLGAIALMKASGLSLNIITLSALILSVGIVVDDSIVVVENIMRHHHALGKDIRTAAIDGANEIMLPVMAGTATIVAVLIPLLFVGGFVGQMFSPLAKTLIYAISCSLLVSLTIIPLLTVMLGGRRWAAAERALNAAIAPFTKAMNGLKDFYALLVVRALKWRMVTLLLSLGLLLLGIKLLGLIGMEVLPRMDAGSFLISLQTSPASSLEKTGRVVARVEELLDREPAVVSYSTRIGYEPGTHYMGGSGALGVTQAEITVTLTSRKERKETIWQIEERLRREMARIPDIETFVVKEVGGTAKSSTAAPIDVRITGDDTRVLDYLAGEVLARVKAVPGAVNLYRSWSLNTPEVNMVVDEARAAALGLTPEKIVRQVYAALEGLKASYLQVENRKDTDIVVRYRAEDRDSLESMLAVTVTSPLGVQVPLRELVHVEIKPAASVVTRENLLPSIDILGYTGGRPFSHVIADVEKALREVKVPEGYRLEVTGEKADLQQSSDDLKRALLMAVVTVYLLLLAQFRSFVYPVTIMMSVPLVLFGVALGLLLSDKSVSLPAILGLILLVGTVVRNSIVLVDYIIRAREAGTARDGAIVEAVRVRFRPIMMTALACVVGMLPLALEWALGSERFSPLAITVIGGILVATLLTMVVIPVVYALLDDLVNRARFKPAGVENVETGAG